jgi:hypothetical protein
MKEYMYKWEGTEIADKIAEYLSNHANFKTHGKHIGIEKARAIGLEIEQLEDNQDFQDKALSAFHATLHEFGSANTAKVIANQNGNYYLKQFNIAVPVQLRK